MDHLAFPGLDELALLGDVDELAQLGLGGERPVAVAGAGREQVADQHEQPGERAEHAREGDQDGRGDEPDAVGVLPTERARADPDGHEAECRHRRDRRGDRPPPGSEEVEVDDGEQHGGARLGEHTQERRDRQRRGGILGDARERIGAAPALVAQLPGARPGDPRQGGLGRGERAAEEHEDERDDDELDLAGAHDEPLPASRFARNVSSSLRCRPNISRSSSGSAWS